MFRRMMSLAKRLLTHEEPQPAVESVPAPTTVVAEPETPPAPAPKQASKWQSSEYHTKALHGTDCPDCGAPKKVGWYRCAPCHAKAVAS